MTFADQVIRFTKRLKPKWPIPANYELIYPYNNPECWRVFTIFYKEYYADNLSRRALLGINPGRLGTGVTGIPFTDPVTLDSNLGIPNSFEKKSELSSQFIHLMINELGGPTRFFRRFYVGSVCPLGFLVGGKNCNYYDDPKLEAAVMPLIIDSLTSLIGMGIKTDVAFSIGQGKNFKFLKSINAEYHFFERIIPLPHPRWVMQYQKRHMQNHILAYSNALVDVPLDE